MDKQGNLLRISIAINELHKHGEANVLIGKVFQAVANTLEHLGINFSYEAFDENHNRIYLEDFNY